MPKIDFESAVIERSRQVPVVVDFWAPWCGPCRVLGPIIEDLASQAAGRWELVKLNTDEQPDVAQTQHIRGIPAVKMFHRGQVVADFVGVRSGNEIRAWLDAHLPDERLERLERIMRGWPEGDRGSRAEQLEQLTREHPELAEGRLRLAQVLVLQDSRRARELLSSTEARIDLEDLLSDLTSLADLMDLPGEVPQPLAAHLAGAREALRRQDLDRGLQRLIDAVKVDRSFGNDLARRAAVALFRLLGHQHELTLKHKRQLAMALHV